MHTLENFEDLSVQGHGQGLGAEAKTKDFLLLPATEAQYLPRGGTVYRYCMKYENWKIQRHDRAYVDLTNGAGCRQSTSQAHEYSERLTHNRQFHDGLLCSVT